MKVKSGYTPTEFGKRVQEIVDKLDISYYDAVELLMEQENIEPDVVGKLVRNNKKLLKAIKKHAMEMNILKGE